MYKPKNTQSKVNVVKKNARKSKENIDKITGASSSMTARSKGYARPGAKYRLYMQLDIGNDNERTLLAPFLGLSEMVVWTTGFLMATHVLVFAKGRNDESQ